MKVKRVISMYDKHKNNLLKDFEILNIFLDKLRDIVTAKDDDPQMYKIYLITEDSWMKLSKVMPQLLDLDLDKVELYLECFQD